MAKHLPKSVSIIIPAKNEQSGLMRILPEIRQNLPDAEIIVVNDGSSDNTNDVCRIHGARVFSHPYSMGNGAAIKSGARGATGDILVFMDADGQHNPDDIPRLISKYNEGYDMVVGARHSSSQTSIGRSYANRIYNWLASWMVGTRIDDLTSGFRAVRADKFRKFLYLLPNGFSYPTTITMSFFRAGHSVAYVPIVAGRREGKSHIRVMHDGVRFLLIIFKIGTLYAPLKLFFPVSLGFFFTGLFYYLYTYFFFQRFTNMSALLFITSILVFLIGLVSEQITALNYKDSEQ
ncbi:MAG: glycosyltransferase family 2 protein [Proteobacteria bacterium]|nr:glycosyltransferase family 2 protein [Pseudomonadota bacterium]